MLDKPQSEREVLASETPSKTPGFDTAVLNLRGFYVPIEDNGDGSVDW